MSLVAAGRGAAVWLVQVPPSILNDPLSRIIWRIALPAMGAMLLRYANHAVDQFWIGRLSYAATALAAITASNFIIWGVYAQAALFNTGLQALVARAVGAGDGVAQARAIRHGAVLALVLGLLLAAVGRGAAELILRFQQLDPEVRRLALEYLEVVFWGLPISYLGMSFETVYRAEGDTLTPFKLAFLAVLVNAALDPFFIRGWGPLPALGIRGSALVTVGVQLLNLALLLRLHHRRRHERPRRLPLEGAQFLRFLRLGLPVAISGSLFSGVYIALVRILAPFGSPAVAALGLGHTIEGFPHFVVIGFSAAAATLVGQNLGAGRPDRAEEAAWRVVRYLIWILLPLAILYGTFAPQLLALFMNPADPEVIRIGTQYLRMAAAVQIFGGLELTLWQALTGAGETFRTTVLDTIVLFLRLPLAWLLAHTLGFGPMGVWWSIGFMTIVGAAVMTLLFRSGTWKTKII